MSPRTLAKLFVVLVLSSPFAIARYSASASSAQSGGPQSVKEAEQLATQASELSRERRFAEALPLAEKSLALYEAALGASHLRVADSLFLLASIQVNRPDLPGAIASLSRAVSIRDASSDRNDALLGRDLASLASVLQRLNRLVEAEDALKRAIPLLEANPVSLAQSLVVLGGLQRTQANLEAAQVTLTRAIKTFEGINQAKTRPYAVALSHLGLVYSDLGLFDKAQPLLEQTLALREEILPAGDPEIGLAMTNLAGVYQERGQFDQAEPMHRRALALYETSKTPLQTGVAQASNNLAMIRLLREDFAGAEPLYTRALEIRESVLGPQHIQVAKTLETMAVFYQTTKRTDDALRVMSRATDIIETNLRSMLNSGSEQDRSTYMTTVQENTDIAISLRSAVLADNSAAAAWSASVVLRRKGRVLDSMVSTLDRFRDQASDEDRKLMDQLKRARAEYATLVWQAPEAKPGEREQRIRKSQSDIDALESALAARSRDVAAELQAVDLAAVQRAIPEDASLVEFVQYRPFNPKVIGRANRFGAPRYAAFVLRRTGAPRWVELGAADAIDRRVAAVRAALRTPSGPNPRQTARDIAQAVIDPLESLIAGSNRVLIAADGQLNVMPFAALIDAQGRFLIDRFEITNLASGRDLLRLVDQRASRGPAVIVANPDFGPADAKVAPSFAPLAGTAGEAKALGSLLPGSSVLTGPAATESALKSIHGPRVLHVATHGVFLDARTLAKAGPPDSRGVVLPVPAAPESAGRQALVRSFLVLAGANRPAAAGAEDGRLSALEAASLDLRGTQLVVLSACETGLGEVRSGDGVHGLRRALSMAGAESQVMSLWQVNDRATRDFMIAYYKQLAAGSGRAAALRSVQQQFIKSKTDAHPYYWAAFTIAGDWTPLRAN